MERIGIWIISAVCIFAIGTAYADDGEAIFKSQGCKSCHKKEGTSKVKNPSPEGPALISPHRGGVYLETSNGMMEWWKNGILGTKSG
jgi:mono/diheme cytochrome c family protein